jgi:hypothetical protein
MFSLGTLLREGGEDWEVVGITFTGGERYYMLLATDRSCSLLSPAFMVETYTVIGHIDQNKKNRGHDGTFLPPVVVRFPDPAGDAGMDAPREQGD